MKKRRRVYKKYDWKKHQLQCIMSAVRKILAEEIDKAILYGGNEMPSVRIALPDYLLKKVSE